MSVNNAEEHVVWLARHVSTLFTRLGATINEWAKELESDAHRVRSAGSPLSNHTNHTNPSNHTDQSPAVAKQTPTPLPFPANHPVLPALPRPVVQPGKKNNGISVANRPRKKRRDFGVRPASGEKGKIGKRVRVNWSENENKILFETIERFSSFEEDELVLEVVKALSGSRTRFQTKGRFRNLLASGKIRSVNTSPRQWMVMPGNFGKRARAREERERERLKQMSSPSDGEQEKAEHLEDVHELGSKMDEDEDETDHEHREKSLAGAESEDSFGSHGSEDAA